MAPSDDMARGEGERAAGARRRGMISGQSFQNREVSFRVVSFSAVEHLAVVEGDIILGTAADLEANFARGYVQQVAPHGVGRVGHRWPGGRVPFEVARDLPNPERVRNAIAHWEAKTRIRFVELTGADANEYPDHVKFVPGNECFSSIGVQGGCQNVILGPTCGVGNAIHEIGHTLGLWHEQSREDRNEFVDILWENIKPESVDDFKQNIHDTDDVGDYDYGSIMHYRRRQFSRNHKDTIRPRKPRVKIGQRVRLSAGDISAITSMYPEAGA